MAAEDYFSCPIFIGQDFCLSEKSTACRAAFEIFPTINNYSAAVKLFYSIKKDNPRKKRGVFTKNALSPLYLKQGAYIARRLRR